MAKLWGYYFHTNSTTFILTKYGCGVNFGQLFFTKASGHPASEAEASLTKHRAGLPDFLGTKYQSGEKYAN
jgi:hypothetical protein